MSRLMVISFSVLTLAGCAQTAREVAKEATPGTIQGAVEELSKPETQQAAVTLAQSPIWEQMGRTIARGAAGGIMESVPDESTRAQFATDGTSDPWNYF